MSDSTDGDGIDIEELFGLLGNEPRMRIMRVLWEEFHFEDYVLDRLEPVTFTEIKDRTGVGDSGNFNYHLGRLEGVFLEDVGGGYRLTPLGYNLMRAIEEYGSFAYATISPTELTDPCPFCGGTLEGSYERELVNVRCRDCGGFSDGNINFVNLPATNVHATVLEDLLDPATYELEQRVGTSLHGRCWSCYHDLDREVVVCEDHERGSDGLCDRCGSRNVALVEVGCPNCGTAGKGPLLEYALLVPRVRAAFDERGEGPTTSGPWQYRLAALGAAEETVGSEESLTVTYQFDLGDECVAVSIDVDEGLTFAVDR